MLRAHRLPAVRICLLFLGDVLSSAAVLVLGGCGRKGMLALPPNTPPQAAAAAQADADHEPAASAPSGSGG